MSGTSTSHSYTFSIDIRNEEQKQHNILDGRMDGLADQRFKDGEPDGNSIALSMEGGNRVTFPPYVVYLSKRRVLENK